MFVYGTLLRGESNHGLLLRARPLGPARTAPRYALVDLGGFPGMLAGGGTAVHGELYALDPATLERVDELEGHPHFYQRRPVELDDGRRIEAYLLRAERARGCPAIGSGDWRRRRAAAGGAP